MTVFAITVYYDTTCAWCIIGHRVLGQAIDVYQRTYPGGREDSFQFDFQPYYLRPNAPVDGVPLQQAMIEKNGAKATESIKARVSRIAQSHGIQLSYGSRTGNTRKSHQLIWQAGQGTQHDLQKELVSQILSMHFEQDGDITSDDDLANVAERVGIRGHDARQWIADEAIGRKVDELAAKSRADGVTSVPTYFINGLKLEGAEDMTAFFETFVEIKSQTAE